MKIRTEVDYNTPGTMLGTLEPGDMFSMHDPKTSSSKYVVLRKTAKFGGTPSVGRGRTIIAICMEHTGDMRYPEDGGGEIVEHSFNIFQGVDLERTVYRLGKVKTLNIKMEME